MKRVTLLILTICVLNVLKTSGQLDTSESRSVGWYNDISSFEKIIVEKHINPFTMIKKEVFLSFTGEIKSNLMILEDDQIIVELLKATALIGDSHTTLNIPITRLFPYSFYCFDDGIFPTMAGKDNESVFGKRLVRINNYSIEEVIKMVEKLIPYENESQLRSAIPGFLVRPEILHGLGIMNNKDTCSFVFSDNRENRQISTVSSIPSAELGKFRKTMISINTNPIIDGFEADPYWYKVLTDNKTLYINYNRCLNKDDYSFKKFSLEILKLWESLNINKLIIDLRNNDGGNSSVFNPMVTAIKNSNEINKKGKVFVLIGRKTFSSAVINAIELKQNTNAIFIGEPTGGKPNHFGEVKSKKLEYSGIQIKYSTRYFKLIEDESNSFYPDSHIPIMYLDYLEGRDPALTKALKWSDY